MAINRWDTFRDVVALQNRMNSLFQDFSRNGENELVAAGFVPRSTSMRTSTSSCSPWKSPACAWRISMSAWKTTL